MTSLLIKPKNDKELYLIKELLTRMRVEFSTNDFEADSDSNFEKESDEWYKYSMLNFNRAYSDEEPNYTSDMVKEFNPEYKI